MSTTTRTGSCRRRGHTPNGPHRNTANKQPPSLTQESRSSIAMTHNACTDRKFSPTAEHTPLQENQMPPREYHTWGQHARTRPTGSKRPTPSQSRARRPTPTPPQQKPTHPPPAPRKLLLRLDAAAESRERPQAAQQRLPPALSRAAAAAARRPSPRRTTAGSVPRGSPVARSRSGRPGVPRLEQGGELRPQAAGDLGFHARGPGGHASQERGGVGVARTVSFVLGGSLQMAREGGGLMIRMP